MSTTSLREGLGRRLGVVSAAAVTIGLVAVVAPSQATVSASAEIATTTSTSAVTAGELTAASLTTVESLTPVIATSTLTSTTASRLTTTTSRTVTRTPTVAPYAFGTKAYSKWWARWYMVNRYGWKSITQFQCLNYLWARESGWNHKAANPYSRAYGIPQALPGSKMSTKGSDWRWNPKTQIRWGLSYIKNRYTSPCGAWSAFKRKGWY